MEKSTQVPEILRKVQHPKLQDKVKALEVRADFIGITHSEAANHLTYAVSKMPEYQFPQTFSGLKSSVGNSGGNSGDSVGPRKGGCNSGIILNSHGKVHTGYY